MRRAHHSSAAKIGGHDLLCPPYAAFASSANAEQFLIVEDVLDDGHLKRVDAYFQMFSLPEYKKARNTMLAILGGSYKPVYSQNVDAEPPSPQP